MLLSRFWYAVIAAVLGGAVFLLYLAMGVSNRTASKTGDQLLTAASRSVYWYLTDDGRQRATALIPIALNKDVRESLSEASKAFERDKYKEVKKERGDDVKSKLTAFANDSGQSGLPFDALWAVDTHGRVLANYNFEAGTGDDEFEMGGYALVADALHGWIRDDAWVIKGQIYRVVARPVEASVGGLPVGAVVGAKMIDDKYVQNISDKTGAAVAFYAGGTRVAKGTPPSFDAAWLSVHDDDLAAVEADENYNNAGRTSPRTLRENPGYLIRGVFARVPGEAWDLGAGYLVGHKQTVVASPFAFQDLADQNDKDAVPVAIVAVIAVGLVLLGLFFTVVEHTMPLRTFRKAVAELADKKSETDVLQPSTFRGVFKKIASDVNDAVDKVAAKAGIDRGPADLESVLGPLPAAPQMSAFSVPGDDGPASQPQSKPRSVPEPPASGPGAAKKALPKAPRKSLPKPPSSPEPEPEREAEDEPPESGIPSAAAFENALRSKPADDEEEEEVATTVQDAPQVSEALRKAVLAADKDKVQPVKADGPVSVAPGSEVADDDELDEEGQWRKVYADFIAMKRKFGEPTEKLTYEKFKGTLQRNKDALMARHKCTKVRFRVYEKQGRAALKASPVK